MYVISCFLIMVFSSFANIAYSQTTERGSPPAGIEMKKFEPRIRILEALDSAKVAKDQGKSGETKGLRQNAEVALTLAKKAQEGVDDPDLRQGVKSLERAVLVGKAGETDLAVTHVESAIRSLTNFESRM